ncbi:IS110 family transposase [bacterium]|nr:MAG: IS110 family transposase [bacterium]
MSLVSIQAGDQPGPQPSTPSAPPCFVGIDVAKAELVIARSHTAQSDTSRKNNANKNTAAPLVPQAIVNRARNIKSWLKTLPESSALIVESTGTYHRLVCDLAYQQGFTVYLINPHWLCSHRKAQGKRAKTDRCDAQLLRQYGEQNHQELRPYQPISPEGQRLTQLLRERSQVMGHLVALRQSLTPLKTNRISPLDIPIEKTAGSVIQELEKLVTQFDLRIQNLVQGQSAWQEQAQRLRQIPGLGPLSVASLLAAFERGEFKSAESFVAYLGLDPVACDSGSHRGQRRISKKGDPMVRKTLYMAATAAMRTKTWKEFAQRYQARGLHHTQVACIVARRMAVTAWCLIKRQSEFIPEKLFRLDPCTQT